MRSRKSVISAGDQADGRKSGTGIPAAEMVEFEVMVLGEEIGNRIGPQFRPLKQVAGAQR